MLQVNDIQVVRKCGYCEKYVVNLKHSFGHRKTKVTNVTSFIHQEDASEYKDNLDTLITAYQQLKRKGR